MDLNKFSSVPADPKTLFGNIFNNWIKGEKLTFTDCCDANHVKAWLLFSALSDCSFGEHARRFQRVNAILITALKKNVISTRQEPRNPSNWLESTCASVGTLQTDAGRKKTTSRKGGQRSGRGRAGAWKRGDGELHNSSMRKKKNTHQNTHAGRGYTLVLPEPSSLLSAELICHDWSSAGLMVIITKCQLIREKHSGSHGNRGFWDMTMPRMDAGWANKQFKVELNVSMVAFHILFSQFLHATNLMDVLLTCVFGFTLEQIIIKKNKHKPVGTCCTVEKKHFSLLLSFFLVWTLGKKNKKTLKKQRQIWVLGISVSLPTEVGRL